MTGFLVTLAIMIAAVLIFLIVKSKKPPSGVEGTGWRILGPKVLAKTVSHNVELEQGEKGWIVKLGQGSLLHAVINRGNGPPGRIELQVTGNFTKKDGSPANVGLYIQRKGDNWSADGKYEYYRFYSPTVPLKEGPIVLDFPLTGWHSVHGLYDEAKFQEALANIDNYGVRVGPHGAIGHGSIEETNG